MHFIDRISISSGTVWEDKVGYSRAVRVGNVIEVSGTTAVENDVVLGEGSVYDQSCFIFSKIEKALSEAGADLHHVVRTRAYITDISRWIEYANAHALFFGKIKPATSLVEVSNLIQPDLLIEIEATAIIPG